MARYDYKCPSCGKQFEVEHPMSERPRILCPDCGGRRAAPCRKCQGLGSRRTSY